jgi:hypothetical protein
MRPFFSSCCLLLLSLAAVPVQADFDVIAGWDRQLFPSFIIGTSSIKTDKPDDETRLGESDGLLGIAIEAPEDETPIEVSIECDGFLEPSRFSGSLSEQGTTYFVYPKVKYKFDRLSQCTQATPATMTYRVTVGETTQEKSVTVTFRSINDCPLCFQDGDTLVSTNFIFASYVNEQHPFIDKLLREALDIGVVDAFAGYQSGTEEDVLRQVYALWDLLVERDVRYSSVTTTAADSSEIGSQHVRLLEETINNQQANCVDGSVLFVSMLRKIDIEASLVLVPGHCYVTFFLDKEQTKQLGLETTFIGADMETDATIAKNLDDAVPEESRGEQSWASFVNALGIGTKGLEDNREAFSNPEENQYRIIDIAKARRAGVLPIPHRSQETFVSFDHSMNTDDEMAESTEEDEDDDENDSEDE